MGDNSIKYPINYSTNNLQNLIYKCNTGFITDRIQIHQVEEESEYFPNALYYIGFCMNFNIWHTVSDLLIYLKANIKKKQYVYFSCSEEYIYEKICKTVSLGADYSSMCRTYLDEIIKIKNITIVYDIKPDDFKEQIKKLIGNCIVTIYGHGSNAGNSGNISMNYECGDPIAGGYGCNKDINKNIVITGDYINQIGTNNPKKYILILFISCYATLLIESITEKNIITITPTECRKDELGNIRNFLSDIKTLSDLDHEWNRYYKVTNNTGFENFHFWPLYIFGNGKVEKAWQKKGDDDDDFDFDYGSDQDSDDGSDKESDEFNMPNLCLGLLNHSGKLNEILPTAIDLGYRHFDGADAYGNDEYCEMLKKNLFEKITARRKEFWITWKGNYIKEHEVEAKIKQLNCGYIDLYLVHFGCGSESDFKELKKLQTRGLVRYYGVSNCEDIRTLHDLKIRHNIYANQLQARPPGGKISYRNQVDLDFFEQINAMGIKVMLFASISGILNSAPEILFEEPPLLINKYYYQKYIKDSENVLIVGSAGGTKLKTNLDLAITPDLDEDTLLAIEARLQQINLSKQ